MPNLISPDKAGSMTDAERADLEAELRGQAGQLSHDLSVGDNSPNADTRFAVDKSALDAELAEGSAIFQQMSERAIAEYKSFLIQHGVPESKIDRALRLDGLKIPEKPIDPELADLHRQTGVPHDAKPEDYSADYERLALDLPPERLANVEHVATQFAADLKLDPALGKGVIEHLVQVGQQLAKMDGDQRAKWTDQQTSALLKQAGNRANAVEIREKAEKVLAMSGVIKGPLGEERFADAIKAGAIGKSAWLLLTLANHFDAMQRTERARKQL